MLGFPLLYFKGMRLMMFQLSGFYCNCSGTHKPLAASFRCQDLLPGLQQCTVQCDQSYTRSCQNSNADVETSTDSTQDA